MGVEVAESVHVPAIEAAAQSCCREGGVTVRFVELASPHYQIDTESSMDAARLIGTLHGTLSGKNYDLATQRGVGGIYKDGDVHKPLIGVSVSMRAAEALVGPEQEKPLWQRQK